MKTSSGSGKHSAHLQQKKAEHRINHHIKVPQVRLVGDNVTPGIYDTRQALAMAEEMGLDLVEISPTANPPVVKIIDYKKFLYEKKKKEKEIKAKTAKTVVKEVRFTSETNDHDFEFKCRHAHKFLEDNAKVKAYVQFKGRGILFAERGQLILLRLAEKLSDVGVIEQMPKLEGKRMSMIIAPKGKKK